MPFNIFALLTCFFSLFIAPVLGQNIYSLGIEDGLSNNSVTSIHKDEYGFMWFGTFDGLNRFDGYTFTKFRKRPGDSTSLPNNMVTAIESSKGKMYIATDRGVGVLDNQTLKFSTITYKPTDSHGKSKPLNWPIYYLKVNNGTVYMGTNLGFFEWKTTEKDAKEVPLYKGGNKVQKYRVNSVAIAPNGDVWVACREGLCVYKLKNHKMDVVNSDIKNANSIKFDVKGNLWIGTDAGLYAWEKTTNRLTMYNVPGLNLSNSRIMDLTFEEPDILWIATDGNGVSVIDLKANKLIRNLSSGDSKPLSGNAFYTVYVDNEKRKWIGSMRGGGINVIDNKNNVFTTIRHEPYNSNSLIHNTVYSFCEDGDNIWVGTEGGGISVWNRRTNTFKQYTFNDADKFHPGSNIIPSIVKDDNQNIWIADYGAGVKRLNRNTGIFEDILFSLNANSPIYAFRLFIDKDKDFWVTCLRGPLTRVRQSVGLFKFDKVTGKFAEVSPETNKEFYSIAEDKAGNLWLGTARDLVRFNKKSSKIRNFALGDGVRALHFDDKGYLWIGTYGKGLLRYDSRKDQFKTYNELDGLSNDVVVNIEEDNFGHLWLGTYDGLSKFNPRTSKFENFHAADGLQSNQFYYNASAKLSTGELLFGGIKGFNIFNPANLTTEKHFPPLFITAMRVQNVPVSAHSEFTGKAPSIHELKQIELPYAKSTFSIDFVAIDYSFPEKIQYAYFLKGKDKEWNYTNNLRTVNYSSLMDGSYTLQLNSTNSSGIWNPKPIEINITILPPWYRSWWAYCLYLMAMGSAGYIYLYYQKEKSRLQYDLKLSALKAVQETELNEKRISFFTNVAHELRAPLTLIVNPIKDLVSSEGANIHSVDISSVYRNTRRLLSLVDQLLLFKSTENEVSELKPELLNLSELCNEVFLCFINQIKTKGIKYNFDDRTENLHVFADREKIEIVLFNLLSNAIKYCGEKGSVSLVLMDDGDTTLVLVKNTGPIIPSHIGDQLFEKFFRLNQNKGLSRKSGFGVGLFVSKKIAEMQKGSLTYTSDETNGTVFTYQLPKNIGDIPADVQNEKEALDSHLLGEMYMDIPEPAAKDEESISKSMSQVFSDVAERKPNVLVVDDDSEIRSFLEQILRDNYNIFKAENAEDAFEIVKNEELDIIVSDIMMPGISGVEFCSSIKESNEFSHIPVILLTGTSSPEVKLKGIECGADDYITKPFERQILLARIKSILKGRDSLKKYFFNEVTLQSNNEKVSEEYSAFLKKGIKIVERHLKEDDFNVKIFIEEMGMSRSNVLRRVKSISGLTISEFIRYIRLKKAAELMLQTDVQIKEVAFEVGINDVRYFRQQFNKVFGINPSDYIKKYRRTFWKAPGS